MTHASDVGPERWQVRARQGATAGRRVSWRRLAGRTALTLYFAVLVSWLVLPIALTVLASFQNGLEASFNPESWSLSAYAAIPDSYWVSLWFTVRVAFWATMLALAVAVPAAWGLVRGGLRERRLIGALVLLPDAVPSITMGIALLILFIPLGLSNSFAGTLIALVALSLAMGVRFTEALVEGMPEEFEHAAVTLGAGRITAFFTVTLPLLAPGLVIAALFIFMHNLVTFELLFFISGPHAMPISVRLFTDIVGRGVLPHAIAMSAILVYIAVAFYTFLALAIGSRYMSGHVMSRKG